MHVGEAAGENRHNRASGHEAQVDRPAGQLYGPSQQMDLQAAAESTAVHGQQNHIPARKGAAEIAEPSIERHRQHPARALDALDHT
jgi:hypothetical protein